MAQTCQNCGTANADEAAFCISCGRPLAAPTQAGPAVEPATSPPPTYDQPPPYQSPPPYQQPAPPPFAGGPPPAPGGYPPPPGYPPTGYPPPGPGGAYGAPMPGRGTGQAASNNMGMAIAATVVGFLCGCFGVVPGVVAIIMASQVNGKLRAGDVAGAQQSARSARTWSIVAFITAGVLIVLGILLNVLGNGSFHFSTSS